VRIAAFLVGLLGMAASAQVRPDQAIVVLPFENTAQDARLAWLREGAAILLTDLLAASGDAVVDRDERLQAMDRLQLPAQATLSRASTIRVGHAVGATVVMTGSLIMQGDQLVVRARRIDLGQGRMLPDVEVSGALGRLFEVFGAVTVRLRGGPEGPVPATDRLPPTPQVFELLVKGLVADTPATALSFLEQTLKAAPQFDRARLAVWELHTEASEYQRALGVVSAIPPGSPLARDGRFRSALSLMHLKRFDDALTVLRGLQSETPEAAVVNAIGVAELRRTANPTPGRATYYFSQASELDTADGDYCFNLGYAYWLDKDPNAAIYWLREAVRRDPADGDAHFILGVALQQIGAAAEAVRERELALRLSSKYTAWESRAAGRDLVPLGIERLHEALRPSRPRVDALITAAGQREQAELAAFHLDAGRRAFAREADREAMQELRRALYLSPYLPEAHLLVGRLQLRGGRPADAVESLKIALWSEAAVPAHLALAEAYLQVGDHAAARQEVERALALDPSSADAQALRAKLGGGPW
jgi:tetratricopeptide (TPR) repeat protein